MTEMRIGRYLGRTEGEDKPEKVALYVYDGMGGFFRSDQEPVVDAKNCMDSPIREDAKVWVIPNPRYSEKPDEPPWVIVIADC